MDEHGGSSIHETKTGQKEWMMRRWHDSLMCRCNMTTVSIDVGIKHLAVCVLGHGETILQWEVLNLLSEAAVAHPTCGSCKRPCRFWNASDHGRVYCVAHAKAAVANNTSIWWRKWGPKKQDVVDACPNWLQEIVGGGEGQDKKKTKTKTKEQWIDTMTLHSLQPVKVAARKKASEASLIDIGRCMVARLDVLLMSVCVDVVLIENQISPIANRMKTLQGMLTAYFLIRYPAAQIHYVSSCNKLRGLGKEKQEEDVDNYAQHKKSAVTLCRGELQDTWLEWFEGHKKKDDLADCYLQGVVWLRQRKPA